MSVKVVLWGFPESGKSWLLAAMVNDRTIATENVIVLKEGLAYLASKWDSICYATEKISMHPVEKDQILRKYSHPNVKTVKVEMEVHPTRFGFISPESIVVNVLDIPGRDYLEINKKFQDTIKNANIVLVAIDPIERASEAVKKDTWAYLYEQIDHLVRVIAKCSKKLRKLKGIIFVITKCDMLTQKVMENKTFRSIEEIKDYIKDRIMASMKKCFQYLKNQEIPVEIVFTSAIGSAYDEVVPRAEGIDELLKKFILIMGGNVPAP